MEENLIINGQSNKFEEIIFLTKGDVEVGFNQEFLLYANGLQEVNSLNSPTIAKKTKLKLMERALVTLKIGDNEKLEDNSDSLF